MGWTKEGEWYDGYGESGMSIADWCPTCDPAGIPEPYMLKPCALHTPSVEGSADVQARGQNGSYWQSGSADAGGETNAKWCKLLHGDSIPSRGMVS